MNGLSQKLYPVIELLKKDRKKVLILFVALLGIILVVISSENTTDEKEEPDVQQPKFSESEYTEALEKRLAEIVSSLYGAGRSKVLVTLDCDYETVYARDGSYSKDDKSSDEKSEYIIIDSSQQEGGLVLKTVTPKVRGVAVLCEGGNDPYVQQQINEMLSALLNLGTGNISVSKIQ